MKDVRERSLIGGLFKVIGFVTVFCIIVGGSGIFLAGYWLQAGDEVDGSEKADAIVVLGGSYFRPSYAAELYNRGAAPVVYVSRPIERKDRALLESVGVDLPLQEEIFDRLLRKKGVPGGASRFFGESVISTAQEAQALKEKIGNERKTIILVTSPYHVRRAKMVFEDVLPECTVLATGTPDQLFPKRWWSTRQSALKTVNETVKIFFYMLGGQFESDDVSD